VEMEEDWSLEASRRASRAVSRRQSEELLDITHWAMIEVWFVCWVIKIRRRTTKRTHTVTKTLTIVEVEKQQYSH
jgi:hypothetical protein